MVQRYAQDFKNAQIPYANSEKAERKGEEKEIKQGKMGKVNTRNGTFLKELIKDTHTEDSEKTIQVENKEKKASSDQNNDTSGNKNIKAKLWSRMEIGKSSIPSTNSKRDSVDGKKSTLSKETANVPAKKTTIVDPQNNNGPQRKPGFFQISNFMNKMRFMSIKR